jgi:hypothetical protein
LDGKTRARGRGARASPRRVMRRPGAVLDGDQIGSPRAGLAPARARLPRPADHANFPLMSPTERARRAWTDRAVRRIAAECNRFADTPLIPIEPAHDPGIELALTDESGHPPDRLRHRLARSLGRNARCSGGIGPDTTVVGAASRDSTAASEAYFARMLGLRFSACAPCERGGRGSAPSSSRAGSAIARRGPRRGVRRGRPLARAATTRSPLCGPGALRAADPREGRAAPRRLGGVDPLRPGRALRLDVFQRPVGRGHGAQARAGRATMRECCAGRGFRAS